MFAWFHTYGMCRAGDSVETGACWCAEEWGDWLVSTVPLGAGGVLGNKAFANIANSIEPDRKPAECLVCFFFLSGVLCTPAKKGTRCSGVGGCLLAAQQPLMDVLLVSLLPWGLVVPSPPPSCWAEIKACLGVVYPQLPACCFAGGLRSALLSHNLQS